MTVWIGNDHGGVDMKPTLLKILAEREITIHDAGSDSPEIVRYPNYAGMVASAVSRGEADRGI